MQSAAIERQHKRPCGRQGLAKCRGRQHRRAERWQTFQVRWLRGCAVHPAQQSGPQHIQAGLGIIRQNQQIPQPPNLVEVECKILAVVELIEVEAFLMRETQRRKDDLHSE